MANPLQEGTAKQAHLNLKTINKEPGFSHVVASHLGLVNNPGVVVVKKEAEALKKGEGKPERK